MDSKEKLIEILDDIIKNTQFKDIKEEAEKIKKELESLDI